MILSLLPPVTGIMYFCNLCLSFKSYLSLSVGRLYSKENTSLSISEFSYSFQWASLQKSAKCTSSEREHIKLKDEKCGVKALTISYVCMASWTLSSPYSLLFTNAFSIFFRCEVLFAESMLLTLAIYSSDIVLISFDRSENNSNRTDNYHHHQHHQHHWPLCQCHWCYYHPW